MPWSNGVFNRIYSWAADAAAGIKIRADRMDAEFANYKAGLENCLTLDGQNKFSANVDLNGHKLLNMQVGSATTDGANFGQLFTGAPQRKNLLRNGAFSIWQNGTTIAGSAGEAIRTADCWWCNRYGTAGYSIKQATGNRSRFALRVQRTETDIGLSAIYVGQSFESRDVQWIARNMPTLTLSFYAKKGADFSASGSLLLVEAYQATGTDEQLLSSYSGATQIGTNTFALTGALVRYSITVTPVAGMNEMGVRFSYTPTGTAGADDSFYLEDVQLEVAPMATDFEYVPFELVLMQCQRYFYKTFQAATAPAQNAGTVGALIFGQCVAGGVIMAASLPGSNQLRSSSPTVTIYNPSAANALVRNITRNTDSGTPTIVTNYQRPYATFTTPAGSAAGDALAVHYTISDPTF